MVQTDGEQGRAEMAARMFEFAKANLPGFLDTDHLPGRPVSWDNPKISLLSHPGVNKAVRNLASIAALNCWFRLNQFHSLHPDRLLAELRGARDSYNDATLATQLDARAEMFAKYTELTPAVRAKFLEYAETYRANVVFAASTVLRYCQGIVGEWLEIIPAENFRDLLTELQRLETAPLTVQLRWFGLSEFVMED